MYCRNIRPEFHVTDPETEIALPLMVAMLSLLAVALGMFIG